MILVRELIIDKGREEHIAKHGVTPEEAEEVCRGDPFVVRTRQRRLRVIGQTEVGRYLTVIIAPRGKGIYALVTAREATDKEQRLSRRKKGR